MHFLNAHHKSGVNSFAPQATLYWIDKQFSTAKQGKAETWGQKKTGQITVTETAAFRGTASAELD